MSSLDKDEDSVFTSDIHQAEDLSAKMTRKLKHIPPPLNLSQVGDSEPSSSPLKDFAMLATSPRSPLVQKNLPFRKRAHSYSSTQTSSECDSPESPRIPASPLSKDPPLPQSSSPSPCSFMKSPLASPTALYLNKKFLQEPIKSLLPSPNTSASFFNNECDPIKSPMSLFRPNHSDLLSLPMMDKNSLKSPLQTPTRSVFLQNHFDTSLFFTDIDRFPLKSPLNTPTRPAFLQNTHSNDIFVMPEPISIKQEDPDKEDNIKIQNKLKNEKENIADIYEPVKQEPMDVDYHNSNSLESRSPFTNSTDLCTIKIEKEDSTSSSVGGYDGSSMMPLDCHKSHFISDYDIKKENSSSPRTDNDRSQSHHDSLMIGSYLDNHRFIETFTQNKINLAKSFIQQNFMYTQQQPPSYSHPDSFHSSSSNSFTNTVGLQNYQDLRKSTTTYHKPQTYNKSKNLNTNTKRNSTDKNEEEVGKKTKKELNDERPRRPMNAFMLFAKHQRPLLIQQHPGKDNRAISVVLGTAWRELEPAERADYVRRAALMATEHKRRHPDCWKRRRVRVNNNTPNNNNNVTNNAAVPTS